MDACDHPDSPTHDPLRSRWRSYAFRALFLYLVVYNAPFPLDVLAPASDAARLGAALWQQLVTGFAERVLGTDAVTVMPNGSGDTTFNWVEILALASIAALGTLAWIAIDRVPRAHLRAREVLRIEVRFVLAAAMLSYGLTKTALQQFSPPSVDRLLTTYGESSPMGLLWTFMGASAPYQAFAGAVEVVGGILLLGKRTATAGALVTAAVMSNVVMLNYCYDVPVKLYSSHLLGMALVLIAPDVSRLAPAVLLGQPAPAARRTELFQSRRAKRIARALELAFVGWLVWSNASEFVAEHPGAPDDAPSPIAGTWTVTEFRRDGELQPLLITDTSIWRRVSISPWGSMMLRRMNGESQRYLAEVDEDRRTLTLRPFGRRDAEPHQWTWEQPSSDRLVLRDDSARIEAELHRTTASDALLTTRGFHWVSETPFHY